MRGAVLGKHYYFGSRVGRCRSTVCAKLDPQGQILAAHELTRVISGGHGDDQLGRVEK